jgi:hypothetical protein
MTSVSVRAPRALLLVPFLAAEMAAQSLLGLTTDNRLVPMHAGASLVVGPATAITGLLPGENVVGIDFRPANERLYGLTDQGRLLVIDPVSGAVTVVGSPLPPSMVEYGFDFNPVVDRIRVVTDSGQSYRLHPDTGALLATDMPLAYAPGDVNAGQVPMVGGSAYTNNFAGATSTVLYNLDAARDVLVTQIPPNNGTLNTIGPLGRDVTSVAGFDITTGGTAFAALNTAGAMSGTTQLFRVDLATGALTFVGLIANGNGNSRLRGLAAVPLKPDVEAIALTADGRLLRFDLAMPWLAPAIAPVSGLMPGEHLHSIDFRPATGQLYGLGSTSRLYTIDTTSGIATAVGAGFATPLVGTAFGFDFNPTVDRIRIVSDADQNLRAHPDTGAIVASDLPLVYATGDSGFGVDPAAMASAYTNNLPGATSTLLYNLDAMRDVLVTQVPPNNGVLNTVGPLGRDITGIGGFDIATDGRAFAAIQDATGSWLVRIDLATGTATNVIDLGAVANAPIRGLAVRLATGVSAFGTATAGCAGPVWLGASGTPFAGSALFTLHAHRGPANAPGFYVLSAQRLLSPLDFGGIACWLDPTVYLAMPMRTNDAAGASMLTMPLLGAWFGLDFYTQWIGFDGCGPLGLATSAGLRVTIQ